MRGNSALCDGCKSVAWAGDNALPTGWLSVRSPYGWCDYCSLECAKNYSQSVKHKPMEVGR